MRFKFDMVSVELRFVGTEEVADKLVKFERLLALSATHAERVENTKPLAYRFHRRAQTFQPASYLFRYVFTLKLV